MPDIMETVVALPEIHCYAILTLDKPVPRNV